MMILIEIIFSETIKSFEYKYRIFGNTGVIFLTLITIKFFKQNEKYYIL